MSLELTTLSTFNTVTEQYCSMSMTLDCSSMTSMSNDNLELITLCMYSIEFLTQVPVGINPSWIHRQFNP